ncbi:RNA 2'-phosphotransferase [Brevibacillus laterosporus]|uniref:RNA 2'-phosphotransferase n=1 Tax=Brevibacillus laterosporus TaxID=1465 RepID=UPI000E6BB65E|nr:RNA 2'-phosphotransferase [Brevibacillus laterosporus]AYB38367.1 RNA 2'-phosphotransferase [Brevibacillus laterosporus]MBM7110409.1 RNA 2'-phosphotransferase [Brevibacillus laterosporus]
MNYQKLSKEISYALRHAPHEYELELDEYGWVHIEQLLHSLHEQPVWHNVHENDLHIMISQSDKKRHEIHNGKIRALYGHSTAKKVLKEESEPPEFLYHGTPKRFVALIMEQGLLPKGRQYVHLSEEIETATQVGKRRDKQPAILKIEAKKAWIDNVTFYHGNEMVWLADKIDKQYISILE